MAHARPQAQGDFSRGLLHGEHFQIAYATNDIERAKAIFAERYGITRFATLQGPLPGGGDIHIELAWCGGVMYELLTASGSGSAVYVERLPTDRFAIQHHHLGFLVESEAAWENVRATISSGRWAMPVDQNIAGFMRQIFVETPELGHLCEYLWPEPAGLSFFFETVPNNA